MFALRPYQTDGVQALRAAYAQGALAPLYVLPTGGGKTVIFSYIAANAASRGTRVCILVHRRELLDQTSRALAEMQVPHGVIAPGHPAHRGRHIQVASVQTLVRRTGWEFDLLVLDEAHHARAGTWQRIIASQPDARLLGVTATPCRLDGKGLGDVFDCLISGPPMAELIQDGHLSPFDVWAPPLVSTEGLHRRAGDYKREEAAALMDRHTITGSAVEHYQRLGGNAQALAFCVSVQHAEHGAAEFQAAGYSAVSIDGKLDKAERDRRVAGFRDGDVQILTSCDLVSEGLDIPAAVVAILLRPTESPGLYMQQVGRVLRPGPGKRAVILDHVGNVTKHGFPDAVRPWTLERGAPERVKEPDGEPDIRQCEMCYYVHAWAPVCPACGHVYQLKPKPVPEVVKGELEKLTPEEVEKLERRGSLADFHRLAKDRGHKPGWAFCAFKARQARRRKREEMEVAV